MSIEQFDAAVIVPTNPVERAKIKKCLEEINEQKRKIELCKILIKEQIEFIVDDHKLPKKLVTKLASTYFKQSLDQEAATHEKLEELYSAVVGTPQQ
jgi:hypothetical protein